MLKLNPYYRITAQEALNDAWIQNNTNELLLKKKYLKNLSKFSVLNF